MRENKNHPNAFFVSKTFQISEKPFIILLFLIFIFIIKANYAVVTETITSMPDTVEYGLPFSDLNTIDDSNRPQTKVLLITAHRSGSTFLGELFNQNEKAFYLFEPLAAIQSKMSTMGCDENSEEKIK